MTHVKCRVQGCSLEAQGLSCIIGAAHLGTHCLPCATMPDPRRKADIQQKGLLFGRHSEPFISGNGGNPPKICYPMPAKGQPCKYSHRLVLLTPFCTESNMDKWLHPKRQEEPHGQGDVWVKLIPGFASEPHHAGWSPARHGEKHHKAVLVLWDRLCHDQLMMSAVDPEGQGDGDSQYSASLFNTITAPYFCMGVYE